MNMLDTSLTSVGQALSVKIKSWIRFAQQADHSLMFAAFIRK